MDNRIMKPITEFCSINMGQSPDSKTYNENGDGIPFYQGNADFGELHPKTRVWCSSPVKIAEKDDILISVRAPIGAMNIATEKCCIGRGLAAITPNTDKCVSGFLFYALKSKTESLIAQGTGSTFKAIGRKVLEDTKIPEYSIDEQQFIVDAMSSAERAISIKNEQYANLESFVKSRFIEMFGEPFLNPKGWESAKIADVVNEVRYGTSRPAVDGGKYPYLRMNNLTFDGHLDLTDLKYIDIPDSEIEKCIVRKGDVLFNRTNSVELVGKTCVFDLDDDMVIAGYIIRVRLNEKMLPAFLSTYMNSAILKGHLRGMAKGAVNQANINAQELQGIEIYLPPIELQQQFADFVEQVEKAKQVIKEQFEQLEILKKSLMQKYFG